MTVWPFYRIPIDGKMVCIVYCSVRSQVISNYDIDIICQVSCIRSLHIASLQLDKNISHGLWDGGCGGGRQGQHLSQGFNC